MKQLVIVVTKRDIVNASSGTCECPIAQSLRRRFPSRKVRVDYWRCHVGRQTFLTTGRMEAFMNRYDNGVPVTPTWFLADFGVAS